MPRIKKVLKVKAVKAKVEVTRLCTCGCRGVLSGKSLWLPGHDQRAKGHIKQVHRGELLASKLSPLLFERRHEIGFLQASPYREILEEIIAAKPARRTRKAA